MFIFVKYSYLKAILRKAELFLYIATLYLPYKNYDLFLDVTLIQNEMQ